MGLMAELGVRVPVVQAGMGGGLSAHELAAAVSAAGGLGTIGILPAARAAARDRRRPRSHAGSRRRQPPAAVRRPGAFRGRRAGRGPRDLLGEPRRRTPNTWIHQCGSLAEARAARAAGADAVIAQGAEAGGHVRGTVPAAELLERVRADLPDDYPVLSAGGVADAADAAARIAAGADAVVCGTRFLLSEESAAHPLYKARLIEAHETIRTQLFGLGWPAPHRVVPNAATARWLRGADSGPRWLLAVQRASAPLLSRAPMQLQMRLAATQAAARPLFGPAAATAGGPANLVEAGPLYAGECVARIADIRPAGALVRELAAGL